MRVERVSTGPDGVQLAKASASGVVSADGRYAAFLSGDPAGGIDKLLYLKDLRSGRLSQVPENLVYTTLIGLSADGRRIAYSDGNRYPKPYVYDRVTGETRQLWPAEGDAYELGETAAISGDGRSVAYTLGNRHGLEYAGVLYVRDLVTGADDQIVRLDRDSMVSGVALDAKGRSVAYGVVTSSGEGQIHVRDRRTGTTRRVDTGTPAHLVQLSADGHRVLFNVQAADGTWVAHLRDLRTDRVRRLADGPAAAGDGSLRHILLTDGDSLVLRDLRTGRERTIAPTASATALPGSVTRTGDAAVFTSTADDLVPGDTNEVSDVFVTRPRR
ncbi:TolB family protein [Streptomyces sp. LaPpAH-108]|uniref:TolB family protein n=1 Tax=Streptomyces sp. LaPpAH-108 TaxID=1155714 RepID=UPI0003601BA3|nr:hypothetical protein [Streptomyces sp. LaPpAH-108]